MCRVSAAKDGYREQRRSLLYLIVVEPIVAPYQHTSKTDYVGSSPSISIFFFLFFIITNTKLNCAVTRLLFNSTFQKLFVHHWQG